MTLDEARAAIGQSVGYLPRFGPVETGVITGVSDRYVFVRYGAQETSKATRAEDLRLLVANWTCWCGGQVGPRVPGDHDGLGCLENITHNWRGGDR
jgi:hypothetical protein